MRELEVLRRLLEEAFEEAKSVHHEYGQEWSAGRQRGLSDALEMLDRVEAKAARLAGRLPGRP
jgi:hypothetical protein